jgi:putative transposase
MIGEDTHASRRDLIHLENAGKTYFTTFSTWKRAVLPGAARTIALQTIVREHRAHLWLHCAVVMPDHVHLVFTPYAGERVPSIMQRIKGASAHRVNRALNRRGVLWQSESFDRIIRSDDNLRAKCEYVVDNPVRAQLVTTVDAYLWTWREWVDDRGQARAPVPPLETTEVPRKSAV